jgi:predicted anti-sigma-YlaC factor YlaD
MIDVIFHKVAYPCEQVRDFMYDYLEGSLSPVVKARFRLHLAGCEDCRGFLRLYRMAANPSVFLEETPPPAEMLGHTLRFLEAEGVLAGKEGNAKE